jgi:methylglutaconyl-CoA hydratase
MGPYQHIQAAVNEGVFYLTLAREHKRNAMDETTMDELTDVIRIIGEDSSLRAVVLNAKGQDFCAGADLDWMRNTGSLDSGELQHQNLKLQKIFENWYYLPVFTITLVHGKAFGGGLGLIAASDLVIAHPETIFRFPEVTLGLLPATIMPFILQRTSSRFIRNAMLTAMPFDAYKALEHGMVDLVGDQQTQTINLYLEYLNKTQTGAVGKTKSLMNDLRLNRINTHLGLHTAQMLAQARLSEDTQNRIAHFFTSTGSKI